MTVTEQGNSLEISALSDNELINMFPLEFGLMRETRPEVFEHAIGMLTAEMSGKDRELVSKAVEIIKPLYKDKERRYSETASILHPYRLALAINASDGYQVATLLLHDVTENFGVTSERIREHYKNIDASDDIDLIVRGVDAFSRRKPEGIKESYNEYIKRLKDTASGDPRLSYLIDAKAADMVQNSLDPGALPAGIKRKKPEGMNGRVTNMLERYIDGGVILLGTKGNPFRRLAAAAELGKRTLTKQNLALVA